MAKFKFYKVTFENKTTTSFIINRTGQDYYGELNLANFQTIDKNKFMMDTLLFDGKSFEEILEKIISFLSENSEMEFSYQEE